MASKKSSSGGPKGAGRPRSLGTKLPATLAHDLERVFGLRHRVASAVAWQTLHEMSPRTYPKCAPPDFDRMIRFVASGKRPRIEISSFILINALLRLPKK
jgi:hypothetical protein